MGLVRPTLFLYMRLILVRHGETEWNRLMKIQGRTDVPLNENGLTGAKAFALRISRSDYNITSVYTSPLSRAIETGRAVADLINVPLKIKDGLIEICFGVFEGLSWPEVIDKYPAEYEVFDKDRYVIGPPQGESYKERSDDSINALKEIITENGGIEADKDILVVTHSATLKAILCPVKHVPYVDMVKAFKIRNLDEVVLEKEDLEEILKYK